MTSSRPLTFRATAMLLVMMVITVLASSASAQLTKADIDQLKIQAQQEGWTFTVTENDATQYSLDQLCGFKVPDVLPSDVRFDPMASTSAMMLPSTFDWRVEAGGLPPIRNQGGCGSCWAFATVGPLECNIKIKDGLVVNLSEQYLVSCNAMATAARVAGGNIACISLPRIRAAAAARCSKRISVSSARCRVWVSLST